MGGQPSAGPAVVWVVVLGGLQVPPASERLLVVAHLSQESPVKQGVQMLRLLPVLIRARYW